MLKRTLKTAACSMLITTSVLLANSTEHTFLDGSSIEYTPLNESLKQVNQVIIDLPFMGPLTLKGNGELTTNGSGNDYTITINHEIDPLAILEHTGFLGSWFNIKTLPKGSFSVQMNDGGEVVKGSQVMIESSNSQVSIGELQATHEFAKVPGSDGLFSNKFHKVVTNLETKHFIEDYDPHVLRIGLRNAYGMIDKVVADFSYLSGKTPADYEKDLVGSFSLKGKKNFELKGSVKAENPFAKVPGAEKMEGFSFDLTAPVIDFSVHTAEEKNDLKEALQTNIAVYTSMLNKYSTETTSAIAKSLQKNKDEIVNRTMKYFEGLTKDDVQHLTLSIKHARMVLPNPTDDTSLMGELNFSMKDFVITVELSQLLNQPSKLVVSMPKPETAINKLMGEVRILAGIYEPVLRDMGYWDTLQNVTDPQKLLLLLRQLSDDPTATGDTSFKMTIQLDQNGIKIGTLSQEKATQIVLGWVLTTLPTNGNP